MERRNAIAAAAIASLTLVAGAGGMVLSAGILGAAADDGVGRVDPVPTTAVTSTLPEPLDRTTTVAPATLVPTTPRVTITERPADTTSATSAVGTEDRRANNRPEADEHEYDGAQDDD
jgi:hypothetical protein